MTMGPPKPAYDPTRDAERYVVLLWSHILKRIQLYVTNHHFNHEPGGKDPVKLPVGALRDVTLTKPVTTGQVLTYAGTAWTNGTATGGAGQAFFQAMGSIVPGAIPGPMNMWGTAVTITRVCFAADGDVSGSETISGASFAFGGSGGTDDNSGLSVTWDDGERLGLTIAAAGTLTYLTADVKFRR